MPCFMPAWHWHAQLRAHHHAGQAGRSVAGARACPLHAMLHAQLFSMHMHMAYRTSQLGNQIPSSQCLWEVVVMGGMSPLPRRGISAHVNNNAPITHGVEWQIGQH